MVLCRLGESEHYAHFVHVRLSVRGSASWIYLLYMDRRHEAERSLAATCMSREYFPNVIGDDSFS
jgi:hypothetical protein